MHQLGGKKSHGAIQVDKRYAHLRRLFDVLGWRQSQMKLLNGKNNKL
jgi:hypothetical protein